MVFQLELVLIDETEDSTLSSLRFQGQHLCFVLEDEYRDEKVAGETRIPEGVYEIVRRYAGRHYMRYSKRYGHKHTFMLKDVPNFKWIMIHIGNRVSETLGCPLVGKGVSQDSNGDYEVTNSASAYLELYEVLTQFTEMDARCYVNIRRESKLLAA